MDTSANVGIQGEITLLSDNTVVWGPTADFKLFSLYATMEEKLIHAISGRTLSHNTSHEVYKKNKLKLSLVYAEVENMYIKHFCWQHSKTAMLSTSTLKTPASMIYTAMSHW